ncbi:Glycosyl transferase family 90 domain containing protein [Hyaloscypha variabilis]
MMTQPNAVMNLPELQAEIVIAYYNEDLTWLERSKIWTIVYNKSGNSLSTTTFPCQHCLPNIGRESHTYIYHIVKNYNRLADVTIFCQGSLTPHVAPYLSIGDIVTAAKSTTHDVTVFDSRAMRTFSGWQKLQHGRKWEEERLTGVMKEAFCGPGLFWHWMFGTAPPSVIGFVSGAIFAVRREAITRRPHAFYKRLLHFFDCLNQANPEEGHYFERFWLAVFDPRSVGFPFGVHAHVSELLDTVQKRKVYGQHSFLPPINAVEALHAMPLAWGGLWITKQYGSLCWRDDGGIETRNESVGHLLDMVDKTFPDLPDFAPTYVCTRDRPTAQVPGSTILAFSINTKVTTDNHQIVRAVPDNVFDHWRNAGIQDYDATCKMIKESGNKPPEIPKAGWIGNVYMTPIRKRLMELGHAHNDLLEVSNTGQWKQVPGMSRFEVTESKYMSLPHQVERYAYLVDVEGNGWSGRLKMLFHSGRPVLLQERQWEEFYFCKLQPFVHYVPVNADLGDLASKINWLKANPELSALIGQAGQAFAVQNLTRSSAIATWAEELRKLSQPAI